MDVEFALIWQRNEKEKEFLSQSQGSGVGRPGSKESDETKRKKDALERQLEAKTAKIRGLEEACRNQEKIIERMEQLIKSKSKGGETMTHRQTDIDADRRGDSARVWTDRQTDRRTGCHHNGRRSTIQLNRTDRSTGERDGGGGGIVGQVQTVIDHFSIRE